VSNHIAHLAAAELWVFVLVMVGIIALVCVFYSITEREDEKIDDLVERIRRRMRDHEPR
jgi:hypothetical protein